MASRNNEQNNEHCALLTDIPPYNAIKMHGNYSLAVDSTRSRAVTRTIYCRNDFEVRSRSI